jgi:hypothetical protein
MNACIAGCMFSFGLPNLWLGIWGVENTRHISDQNCANDCDYFYCQMFSLMGHIYIKGPIFLHVLQHLEHSSS